MKYFKRIALLIATVACLTSCNQDMEGTFIDLNNDLSFAQSTQSFEYNNDSPNTFEVNVVRRTDKGDAELACSVESGNDDEMFTLSPAKFKDGSFDGTITVTYNKEKLNTGESRRLVLKSKAGIVSDVSDLSTTITVLRDYTYETFVTGVYYSGIFTNPFERTLLRAKENPNVYCFKNLFAKGTDVKFRASEEDGTLSFLGMDVYEDNGYYMSTMPTGYVHSSYGMITIDLYKDYSYVDIENKVIVMTMDYYVTLGSFGVFQDTFEWE